MNFGTCVREVIGLDFAQQHRAFDSLGLGQLRGFSLGELEHGPTSAASLRVTVAPAPVLDGLLSTLHALVSTQLTQIFARGQTIRAPPKQPHAP